MFGPTMLEEPCIDNIDVIETLQIQDFNLKRKSFSSGQGQSGQTGPASMA